MKILDNGYVKYIESWGSDQRIIESARMSSGKGFLGWGGDPCPHCRALGRLAPDNLFSTHELMQEAEKSCPCKGTGRTTGDEKLLAYLWKHRHTTPFEQCGLSVEVQAPIMVFREWHRHRTQSYNEFSARYAQMPNLHYLPTLDRVKRTSTKNKQAQGVAPLAPDVMIEQWLREADDLQQQVYAHYEAGLELGIPKEVARINTPVARYSRMVDSANLLNWLRFLGLRQAEDAQWEIRQYADAVGVLISEMFPRTWALFNEQKI